MQYSDINFERLEVNVAILEDINRLLIETWELQSTDYNPENQNCFNIFQNNNLIGTLGFKLLDGTAVDIYKDTINYKNTKPIVTVKTPEFSNFKTWIMQEVVKMGYKYNPVVINDTEFYIDNINLEYESLKHFLKIENS